MPKMKINLGTSASPNWVIMDAKDADTVDGKHASDFATSTHNHDTVYSKLDHNHDTVYQKLGSADSDINLVKALQIDIDARSSVVTRDGNGRISKVEEKNGATVICTTNVTRDGTTGKISSVQQIAGGKTVTFTVNRNADGTISSITKTVA